MNDPQRAPLGDPFPDEPFILDGPDLAPIPVVLARQSVTPSMMREKGQCVPKEEMPMFHAAVRVALREYHVARMLPLDFTHEQVRHFADSVLANWSMALTTHRES